MKFIEELKKNINFFNSREMVNDLLYNISTARCASEAVANFLNAEKNRDCLRTTFISECAQSSQRFEMINQTK